MIFAVLLVLAISLALLYWYLKDYIRTGAMKKAALASSSHIPMEREKFIPLLLNSITTSIRGKLLSAKGGDSKLFDRLLDKMNLAIQLENRALLSSLIADFEAFDPTYSKLQRATFSAAARQAAEQRFLVNFMHMMEKANFKILSKAELEFAEAEQYLLHIPVTSDWEKLDNTMMPAFFGSENGKKHADANAAPVCKRVVVWRRGIGLDQTTGLLINEKIDVLIEKWFEAAANKLVNTKLWQQISGESAAAAAAAASGSPAPVVNAANVETVERISLKDQPLNLAYFTKPTTIQEPTFKEVVALFRYSPAAEKSDAAHDASSIHIKTFRDIPLGDLDVIFPAQTVLFKTIDFIRLALTGVLGLYFALDQFGRMASGSDVDATMLTACIGLLALASRTYYAMQWSVDTYKTILSETLYNKASDSHRGVILYLAEALEAQEFKEALIAYAFTLAANVPLTEKELDQRCEAFIKDELEATLGASLLQPTTPGAPRPRLPTVDFESDDAIDKIVRFGMATATGPRDARIVTALPLPDAIAALEKYIATLNAN